MGEEDKRKRVIITLPVKLEKMLGETARAEDRTRSKVVERALKEYLKKSGKNE